LLALLAGAGTGAAGLLLSGLMLLRTGGCNREMLSLSLRIEKTYGFGRGSVSFVGMQGCVHVPLVQYQVTSTSAEEIIMHHSSTQD
jgi:hypothetical protein